MYLEQQFSKYPDCSHGTVFSLKSRNDYSFNSCITHNKSKLEIERDSCKNKSSDIVKKVFGM